jgi:hypothetical protein
MAHEIAEHDFAALQSCHNNHTIFQILDVQKVDETAENVPLQISKIWWDRYGGSGFKLISHLSTLARRTNGNLDPTRENLYARYGAQLVYDPGENPTFVRKGWPTVARIGASLLLHIGTSARLATAKTSIKK